MHPLESLEVVKNMLRALAEREEPLVSELPPAPGSRAERYVQLLCPDLHPVDVVAAAPGASGGGHAGGGASGGAGSLLARVDALEAEVEVLRGAVRRLATSLGEPDPFGQGPPSPAPVAGT
jgi:uncharacterized protein YceH (UPF0502 family)